MTNIPTITTIKNNILSDLQGEFDITLNPVYKAFLVVLAGVLAGMFWLTYLALGQVYNNIWVDTCDADTLRRFARIILGRDLLQATTGRYTLSVSGTAGAVIPATTVYKSNDNAQSPGVLYQIEAAYTLTGTDDTITVVGLTGGSATQLATGNQLSLTAPVPNVNKVATVTSELRTPVDAETIEQLRIKVIEKIQLVPGSWNAVDYRIVGLNIAGIGQVYAYGASPTAVNVWLQGATPVADPGPSVSPATITEYSDALDLVRPLPAFSINIASCPINNIDVTVTAGTFPPLRATQRAMVTSALTAFINNVHPFIAAADNVNERNDEIATYNLSSVITAAIPGYGYSAVTFTVNGTPQTYWQADNGNIPFFNSVTFA